MGMFDRVIADFKCPYCGFKVSKEEMEKTLEDKDDTWQTKATAKFLDIYQYNDKLKITKFKIEKGWMEIHHVCPKCNKFVQAEIEVVNGRLGAKVRYIKDLKLFSFKRKTKLF